MTCAPIVEKFWIRNLQECCSQSDARLIYSKGIRLTSSAHRSKISVVISISHVNETSSTKYCSSRLYYTFSGTVVG